MTRFAPLLRVSREFHAEFKAVLLKTPFVLVKFACRGYAELSSVEYFLDELNNNDDFTIPFGRCYLPGYYSAPDCGLLERFRHYSMQIDLRSTKKLDPKANKIYLLLAGKAELSSFVEHVGRYERALISEPVRRLYIDIRLLDSGAEHIRPMAQSAQLLEVLTEFW